MAYFVDYDGDIYVYEVYSPTEIILNNGKVIKDGTEIDSRLFATYESAEAFAIFWGINPARAKELHRQWVDHRGYLKSLEGK